MSLKDILVYLLPDDVGGAHPATRFAIEMAAAFDAHLTALIVDIEIAAPVTLYEGGVIPDLGPLRESRREAARQAGAVFGERAAAAGIRFDAVTERSYSGGTGEVVADQARLRDLTILPVGEVSGVPRFVIEDTLFKSGRPVLLVPEDVAPQTGQHAVLAWDGTAQAVRAMNDALPLLHRARDTTVVTVADEKPLHLDETGQDICRHLGRHGVRARFVRLTSDGRSIGEAIADHARELGADLLVMGGFAHSRLRTLVLGGATRDIIAACPMPTLLSH